jgi:hypothetical protein
VELGFAGREEIGQPHGVAGKFTAIRVCGAEGTYIYTILFVSTDLIQLIPKMDYWYWLVSQPLLVPATVTSRYQY